MKYLSSLLFPIIIFAQINYSGSVSPTYLMRISDGSEISLPFRLADLQLSYSYGNFDLKSNTALEARWKGNEAELDIRELYIAWYPSFGEVKFGKMIHTWGAADGNNPTDNINPYDFYYMFLAGADRKIGVLSGSIKAYIKNINVELIVVPEHTANRLPFGEEDFPIQFPFEPASYREIDKPLEFGARVQSAFGWGDVSISYFNGYDRGFSIFGTAPNDELEFGYRKTDMIGADFVSFLSEFTIRGEFGYFDTSNDYVEAHSNADANYIQYVVQLEYSGIFDINLGMQLLGTNILSVDGKITIGPMPPILLTKDNFTPGMGTPFAMIAKKALVINGSTNLLDNRLSVEAMSLINLEETGYLLGMNIGYSPIENWELKLGVNKFIGDADDPENSFTQMEDFSHLSFGLEFNF